MEKQEIITNIDSAIKRRYERFDRLFVKAKGVGFEKADNGLYRYEKSVTDEARRIAVYISSKREEVGKNGGRSSPRDATTAMISSRTSSKTDIPDGGMVTQEIAVRPQFFSRGAFFQGPTFSSISTVRYLCLSAMPVIMTTVQICRKTCSATWEDK